MKNEIQIKVVNVPSLVKKTKTKAKSVDTAYSALFDVVRECVTQISGEKKLLAEYRKGLNNCSSRSAIFVMIKVAQNEKLDDVKEFLPSSYMTLYEILKLFENELNSDAKALTDLINNEQLKTTSTKAEVLELRKNLRASSADDKTSVEETTETEASNVTDISTNVVALEPIERIKVVSKTIETFNLDELAMLHSQIEELMSSLEERDAA
jgi:hypothetical protein